MKIVFLIQDSGVIYGQERATIDLVTGLRNAGQDPHVLLINETRLHLARSMVRQTLRERTRIVLNASPTLLIPIVIVGSILAGLANATEAAAVGTVAAVIVGRYWTGEFDFSKLPEMLLRAGVYSAIVLFLRSM